MEYSRLRNECLDKTVYVTRYVTLDECVSPTSNRFRAFSIAYHVQTLDSVKSSTHAYS